MFFRKGNQICSHCHKLEEELDALNTEMGQLKLEHNQEKNVLVEKRQKRQTELSQTYSTINPVRVNELEQVSVFYLRYFLNK